MRHLGQIGFHVMCQCVHSRRCSDRWRQFHGEHWVSKDYFCYKLGSKEDLLLMSDVIGNDCTSSNLAASPCRSGYCNEMWYIIRDVNIAPDEVVVLEKVFPMMHTQNDSSCNIQGRTTTNTNDRIALSSVINISALINVRLYGILVNVTEHFDR